MFETKSDVTMSVDQQLLEWIRQRVSETAENGSIFIGIEKGRITLVNYEKNCKFRPTPPPQGSSSDGPRSWGFSNS